MSALGSAEREWVEELAASWAEVYKKSVTTLVLLRIVKTHGPISASDIQLKFEQHTGWTITERGLYRTLKRLSSSDLLAVTPASVPGTGAKRKDFTLTPAGQLYLERITEHLIQRENLP
ncbi:PadR family transcriptional regulator [Rothia sp. ZJ932]|uniref:PadR family transcriptional regulator n=1 Tax=Rothia sp. ZJ932 TaxID=2810516 RepID=UPI001968874B|nr:PadR family transcriptional regulator [Rothia sp. ZJ932]QRZ61724.1 PadR family transcriptional regulator [Rothia sp. ZJ932]